MDTIGITDPRGRCFSIVHHSSESCFASIFLPIPTVITAIWMKIVDPLVHSSHMSSPNRQLKEDMKLGISVTPLNVMRLEDLYWYECGQVYCGCLTCL